MENDVGHAPDGSQGEVDFGVHLCRRAFSEGSAEGEFAFREGCEAQEVEFLTWTATHRRSVHLLFFLRFRLHILLGETIAHLSPCCADITQEMRRAVWPV
jgi:hypothetical protein